MKIYEIYFHRYATQNLIYSNTSLKSVLYITGYTKDLSTTLQHIYRMEYLNNVIHVDITIIIVIIHNGIYWIFIMSKGHVTRSNFLATCNAIFFRMGQSELIFRSLSSSIISFVIERVASCEKKLQTCDTPSAT